MLLRTLRRQAYGANHCRLAARLLSLRASYWRWTLAPRLSRESQGFRWASSRTAKTDSNLAPWPETSHGSR